MASVDPSRSAKPAASQGISPVGIADRQAGPSAADPAAARGRCDREPRIAAPAPVNSRGDRRLPSSQICHAMVTGSGTSIQTSPQYGPTCLQMPPGPVAVSVSVRWLTPRCHPVRAASNGFRAGRADAGRAGPSGPGPAPQGRVPISADARRQAKERYHGPFGLDETVARDLRRGGGDVRAGRVRRPEPRRSRTTRRRRRRLQQLGELPSATPKPVPADPAAPTDN